MDSIGCIGLIRGNVPASRRGERWPTWKQMSAASVTAVEVAGVTAVEELYSRQKIRFRGGQE